MRRILIVGLLFLLMSALPFLQAGGEGAFNPESLAALGFVLLAAYTGGELAARLSLPKITGYILAGLLCGPYVLDRFSIGVVEDLKLINNLAIGLIALTAGAEMKLEGLRAVARTLGFVVAIKASLILIFITGTIFALRPLMPFLADAPLPLIGAVGLIFGVLAMETSPAATIAVINETGARGRLSDITLGVAVSKDVLMVVTLAIGISLAKLFSTPGASFDPAVLLKVGKELLLSVAVGATIGATIWAYLRYVHAEMWLFVIGVVFLTTELAARFHLEAVLVFIVAGFMIRNFTRFGDAFIHPVEAVSLPVYVVFFSIAGAGLDLGALRRVWLIPVILVVVRLIAIYAGTRVATALARESPPIRQNAWLGFISQAGVVLGLVIIVEQNLPGLGSEMQPIVLGMVGINLLLGPIAFKLGLGRVGETREAREAGPSEAAAGETEEETGKEAGESAQPTLAAAPVEAVREYREPYFESAELTEEANRLRERLAAIERDFAARVLAPETRRIAGFLERMKDEAGRSIDGLTAESAGERPWIARLRRSRSAYSRRLREDVRAFGAAPLNLQTRFRSFGEQLLKLPSAVAERISVIEEDDRFTPLMDDGWRVRTGKRLKRARRAVARMFGHRESFRDVALRRLAAWHFGGANDGRLLGAAAALGVQRLAALTAVKTLYDVFDEGCEQTITALEGGAAETDPRERLTKLRERLDERFAAAGKEQARLGVRVEAELRRALGAAYEAWLEDLAIAGGFELPAGKRQVEGALSAREKAQRGLEESDRVWAAYGEGMADACARHFDAVHLVDQVGLAVEELVAGVLANVDRHLAASLRAILDRIQATRERLMPRLVEGGERGELRAAVGGEREAMVNFLRGETRARLRRLRESRELGGMVEAVLGRFAALADELPVEYRVLEERDLAAIGGLIAADFTTAAAQTAPKRKASLLREAARGYLERAIARELADVNRIMYEQVDAVLSTTAETTQIIEFNLKIAEEELERERTKGQEARARAQEIVENGLRHGQARVEAALGDVAGVEARVRTEIIARIDERVREIESLAFQRPSSEPREKVGHIDLWRAMRRTAVRQRARALTALQRYGPLGRLFVADLQATLGLEELSAAEALRRYDEARWDDERLAHLPFLYRRLFTIAPLDSAELLVAREEELRLIETARTRFRAGRTASVAVIGELGSGKTSLINAAIREVFRHDEVFRLNFTRTIAREEDLAGEFGRMIGAPRARRLAQIEARLAEMPGRPVIVLEDLHQLYLRTIGGYEALRALLLLVARTGDRVFWLISMRKYAWRYLDGVERISERFTFVVNTENFSAADLAQAVARRHAVSGFELRFQPDAMLAERRRYRRAAADEQQEMARAAYFEALGRASEGNVLAGIFYWMRSLAEVEENRLAVRPVEPLRFAALREAPVEHLLTLGVIIQQGSLTREEHARIFLGGQSESEAVMGRLASLNLLVRETHEDGVERFAINRPIYIPLVRELRARNVLPGR